MENKMPRTDSTQAMQTIIGAYADEDASSDEEKTAATTEATKANVDVSISESDDDEPEDVVSPQKRLLPDVDATFADRVRPQKQAKRLVSYGADDLDDDDDRDALDSSDFLPDFSFSNSEAKPVGAEEPSSIDAGEFSGDDVQIPPEPVGKCANKLQEKISKLYEKMLRDGIDLNSTIQRRKDFRNPSIYEKLITYCGIDEKGTNYPLSRYNPTIFGVESSYDELAKVQKIEMDRRERERRDKTKIEFVTATKKSSGETAASDAKRKSKWDAQPTSSATSHQAAGSGGAKTTVISAAGMLKKAK